jgi:ATP-dependent DNA helicase RecG
MFRDRIEIISPGTLTNNLTLEMIKAGVSSRRNPVLTTYAAQVLPYHGVGSGIKRVLRLYPDIEFINDKERNQFMVIVKRKEIKD